MFGEWICFCVKVKNAFVGVGTPLAAGVAGAAAF